MLHWRHTDGGRVGSRMRSGTGRWLAATAALGLAGCLAAPPDRAVSGADAAAPSDAGGAAFDLLPSGLPSSTGQLGDDDGGSPYDLLCPPGRFVTGLASAQNGFGLTRLRASCSRL